jgi:heat shock protein HslJ
MANGLPFKSGVKMKTYQLPAIAVLVAHASITACSSVSGGNAAISYQGAVPQGLTAHDIANAGYQIDSLGEFRLDNGEFNRQYGDGATQRHKVVLDKFSLGDLDHDGVSDAAVILAWQSGGSGTFRYLIAMRNAGNELRQTDSVPLGDRVRIGSLSIAGGEVRLEVLTRGPSDPACRPSQRIKQLYRLRDGKWVQSTNPAVTIDSSAEITGIVWKLKRFEDNSKLNDVAVDDSDQYTLTLLPDGTYRAKADCNRMQGQYTREGDRLKLMPGAATLAECGPGSHYAAFLRHLTETASFILRDNAFVLNMRMDGGNLVFENGGPVSRPPRY